MGKFSVNNIPTRNMKLSILLSLLLLITVQSSAQENPDKLIYYDKVENFRKMRNTGTTLTVLGSALTVVGGITMSNSVYNAVSGSESDQFALGSVAFLVGVGSLGSGIPLWIVGARNHQKIQ
jgi:hypothetical protein